jgi:hypothetical protein
VGFFVAAFLLSAHQFPVPDPCGIQWETVTCTLGFKLKARVKCAKNMNCIFVSATPRHADARMGEVLETGARSGKQPICTILYGPALQCS